jgi:hypothetical protein
MSDAAQLTSAETGVPIGNPLDVLAAYFEATPNAETRSA